MTKYGVYVSDDNGWASECPDYLGVFFGRLPPDGCYVSAAEGSDLGGHVEFDDKDEAEAFAESLSDSGDWTVKAPNHPDYSTETWPTYAVAEVEISVAS